MMFMTELIKTYFEDCAEYTILLRNYLHSPVIDIHNNGLFLYQEYSPELQVTDKYKILGVDVV